MKTGDKVVCIDDSGWIIPDPGFDHLSPKKGCVYIVREYFLFGGVGAISLLRGDPEHFYRACRFRPAQEADQLALKESAVA